MSYPGLNKFHTSNLRQEHDHNNFYLQECTVVGWYSRSFGETCSSQSVYSDDGSSRFKSKRRYISNTQQT